MRIWRTLKWVRVGVSLVFFVATGILFLDFAGLISPGLFRDVVYLQFVPSLLNFTQIVAWSAAGFVFVVLLTVLFGRIYCSSICPIGTLQDLFIRINKKIRIGKRIKYVRSYNILRYVILIATIVVFITGSSILLNLLDPFSIFGKIVSNLFRPVYIGMNNLGAWVLNQFDSYALYHVDYKNFSVSAFILALVFLFILYILTWLKGRLFCNTICPVGSLLGLISKVSIFKLKIKETECNSCWKCALNCKAGCIEADDMRIDVSRCIGCLNCTIACPNSGVVFKYSWGPSKKIPQKASTDTGKRNFLKFTALFSLGLYKLVSAQEKTDIQPTKESTIPEVKEFTVAPPGAKSISRFNEMCTACHLCVSACPTQVLQPSFLQYGLAGFMQPYLDYHKNFCNYDCTICTDVCPTGALLPLLPDDKRLVQLGQVHFEKDNCIVETEGTECGACSEHCPTKAVYMVPYKGLFLPEIDQDICVGCGACEYACPTKPYKAIYVDGNAIHQQAEPPTTEELKAPDPEEDFPF